MNRFFVVLSLILVAFSVAVVGAPSAFAAIQYSRSPTGSTIEGELTVNVTADTYDDFGSCAPQSPNYWGILITDGTNDFFSPAFTSTTLNVSQPFALPEGSYTRVSAGKAETTNVEASLCSEVYLEFGDVVFTVKAGPGGAVNVRPGIELFAPERGELLRGETKIRWRAFDSNPPPYGLATSPISLFYSQDRGITFKSIVENIANTGEYLWDTRQVPDGNYEIKILVKDEKNLQDYVRAINLRIKNQGPQFSLKFDPLPAAPDREITITAEANEDAKEPPTLLARAPEREPDRIPLSGSGKSWVEKYKIPRRVKLLEFDVEAKDEYGNPGAVISGKRLPIEILVKTPTIENVASGMKVGAERIDVVGKSEPNLNIHLLANGRDSYRTKADAKGAFKISGIKLTLESKGRNTLVLWAENASGDISEEVVREVIYNVPPSLRFLNPSRPAQVLSGETALKWEAIDLNGDELTYTLELIEGGAFTRLEVGRNLRETSLPFQTTDFPDGTSYRLRLVADDGFARTEIGSRPFVIRNGLPAVRLSIPQPIFLQKRAFELPGEASSPAGEVLSRVEYSLDSGASWLSVKTKDGFMDSKKEEFSVSGALPPGEYLLLFRAISSSGKTGSNRTQLAVDFGAPTLTAQGPQGLMQEKKPTWRGIAKDDVSGIEAVEFKLVATEKPRPEPVEGWFRTTLVSGYHAREAGFIFQPQDALADGTYALSFRAVDRAGNISKIAQYDLTIDTTAPRVGARELSFSGISLYPANDGKIKILPEKTYLLRISVGGNPDEVRFVDDFGKNLKLSLNRNSGVWETSFTPHSTEALTLQVSASDELGNARTVALTPIEVVKEPRVINRMSAGSIQNAEIRVFSFDEDRKEFRLWDAKRFSTQNPLRTGQDGAFSLILPHGTYRLEVKARGYKTLKSAPFIRKGGQAFTETIPLEKR